MGECEAADIIRRSGLATIVEPTDVDGMARALLGFSQRREQLPELFRPDREYIAGFSRPAMARKVHEVLLSLAQGD
jgi:hypothetical protein